MRGRRLHAVRLGSALLVAALVVRLTGLPGIGQSAGARVVLPPGARHVPGAVILDRAGSARSRDIARLLERAGYATIETPGDPLSAAALLARQSAVQGDDLAIVGYGTDASSVLAAIVNATIATLPGRRSFGPPSHSRLELRARLRRLDGAFAREAGRSGSNRRTASRRRCSRGFISHRDAASDRRRRCELPRSRPGFVRS